MKKNIFLLIVILSAVFFCACQKTSFNNNDNSSFTSNEIFAMDTYMTVTAYGANSDAAVKAAIEEIERLDTLLSVGNPDSEIYKLNSTGANVLSSDSCYLLNRSLELNSSTSGLYNVAIYPLMDAWGFTTGEFQVPDNSDIQTLLTNIEVSGIDFDEATGYVTFTSDDMSIDFGGIAKGYTSEKIMSIFQSYGIESGIVSLGGNVQLLGNKPDGSKWKVGIQSPDDSSTYFGVLTTADVAVITSGGYERNFEKEGITYHHIIDPRTGYPAKSGIKSATIVSSDGTLADGLSTAIFIMGLDEATKYWRKNNDKFDMILLTDDNQLYVTTNLMSLFTSDFEITEISK